VKTPGVGSFDRTVLQRLDNAQKIVRHKRGTEEYLPDKKAQKVVVVVRMKYLGHYSPDTTAQEDVLHKRRTEEYYPPSEIPQKIVVVRPHLPKRLNIARVPTHSHTGLLVTGVLFLVGGSYSLAE
jgi:hypothetical protein